MPCGLDDLLIWVSLTQAIQKALPLLSAPAGTSTPRPSHSFSVHTYVNFCITSLYTASIPLGLLEILHWPTDRPNRYSTATVRELGRWAFFPLSLEDQYCVWFICPSGFMILGLSVPGRAQEGQQLPWVWGPGLQGLPRALEQGLAAQTHPTLSPVRAGGALRTLTIP